MKSQKILYAIVFLLVLGGVVYGFVNKNRSEDEPAVVTFLTEPPQGAALEIPCDLPQENCDVYEARAAELTTEIQVAESAGEYSLHLYFERGVQYQYEGKLGLAFADLTKVTQGDPNNETAWNNLGDIIIQMGFPLLAEPYFEKAVEVFEYPTAYNRLLRYWNQYLKAERFDRIGPLLQEAINKTDSDFPYYYQLGEWNMEKGDYLNAQKAFDQAAILEPGNEDVQELLKKVLDAQK